MQRQSNEDAQDIGNNESICENHNEVNDDIPAADNPVFADDRV